jgi:hypothetical protein
MRYITVVLVNLEFVKFLQINRDEISKFAIVDEDNKRVSRNACAIFYRDG